MKTTYLLLSVCLLLTSCVTQRATTTSTIVSCDYDNKKNQTDYQIFPYGSVSIPGKWERTIYNQESKQQFFKNKDGIIIAIVLGPTNKYEFNRDNSKKGFEFVNAFYEWDSDFFVTQYGLKQEIIESNENENYIVWRIFGENNNTHWDSYFLFGEKNGFATNISIMKTEKWSTDEKIAFLKKLFLEKSDTE